MTARVLQLHEWPRFREVFKQAFSTNAPEPSQPSTVVVVEDEGEIIGFVALQNILHLEPAWIREDYRDTTALLSAIRCVEKNFKPAYMVTHVTDPRVASLLETCGMEQLHDLKTLVYRKPTGGKNG